MSLDSLPVLVPDFMSLTDTNLAVTYLKKTQRQTPRPNHLGSLGFENSLAASTVSLENPVVALNANMNEEDVSAVMAITKAIVGAKEELEKFYGVEMDLVQASHTTVMPGKAMGLHSDTTKLDGTPLRDDGTPEEMEWSAVLYLTTFGEDFSGGEIYFPNQDFTYSPAAGALIHFVGDHDHIHKVLDVLSGERISIAMFFARKGNVSDERFFY